jgi:hypothetical protein
MDNAGQIGDSNGPPVWLKPIIVLLLVISIVLAAVGTMLPMADFDVNTRLGPAEFVLESDFTQGTVDYTGSASEYGVAVNGSIRFIEGTGEYQERVGFLKGTAKERTNFIVPYTTDYLGKRAQLNVSIGTDTIPWWVTGVKVPCYIDVELVEMMNVSSLTIDRVYMEFRREIGGEVLSKTAWSKNVNDELMELGKHLRYAADLEVNEDWGKFELFGMVEVTMEDTDGVIAENFFRSYSTEPKTVTLWTIPVGQGVKIAMVVVAMPVTVLGILLAAVATALVIAERRGRLVLTTGGGVVMLLGVVFFGIGVGELASLVGYPDDLMFLSGYWVAMTAFGPAVVAGGLLGWSAFKWPPDDEEEVAAPPEVVKEVTTEEDEVIEVTSEDNKIDSEEVNE